MNNLGKIGKRPQPLYPCQQVGLAMLWVWSVHVCVGKVGCKCSVAILVYKYCAVLQPSRYWRLSSANFSFINCFIPWLYTLECLVLQFDKFQRQHIQLNATIEPNKIIYASNKKITPSVFFQNMYFSDWLW